MTYKLISSLEPGQQYSQVFYLKKIFVGKTAQKGTPFVGLLLTDISGNLKATLWQATSVPWKENSFLKITGTVSSYNNEKVIITNQQSIMAVERPSSTENYFKSSLDELTIDRLKNELKTLLPTNDLTTKLVQSINSIESCRYLGKEFEYDGSLLEFLVATLRTIDNHHRSISDQQYQYNLILAKTYCLIEILFQSPLEVCVIDNSPSTISILSKNTKEKLVAQTIVGLNKELAKYTFALKYTNETTIDNKKIHCI